MGTDLLTYKAEEPLEPLANKLTEEEAQTFFDTLVEVKAEALVDKLVDRPARVGG